MLSARSSCQNQGGDLVLPLNAEEHNAIWNAVKEKNFKFSWIGLIEQQNDTFYSLDGKTPSYTNWGSSEPDPGGNQNCVVLWGKPNGEWHDVQCNNQYPYICQKTYATCTSESCLNGGICSNDKCSCQRGYTGSQCDVDIDECKEYLGICQTTAICNNTIGSYTCTCPAAYTGRNCSINIDDCKTDDGSSKCLNNGTCIDGKGNFSCKCQDPYLRPLCQWIDECKKEKNLCGKGACDRLRNGSAFCICDGTGYNGIFCQNNINECSLPSPPCNDTIATCIDTPGSYKCLCKAGYTGVNCETPLDHCLSRPCQNNATCTTIGNTFKCNCVAGFAGYNCSINVNDCLLANCQNNASCMDGVNEYKCVCGPGFHGSLCQYDANECLALPCLTDNGNCTNRNGSYICECPLGFTGKNCEKNVDDCANVTCFNDGKCKDSTCDCHPGFSGEFCKENIDECQPQPCRNGGTCVDAIAGYTCLCTEKWSGKNCEKNVSKDPIGEAILLLAEKEVNISNVVKTTQEVKKLSFDNSSHPLKAKDINNIATVLQKIVAVKQKANQISEDYFTTVDNVLDASVENVFKGQQDTNSSSRIVEALNNFLETLVIGPNGTFRKVIKRNYAVNIQAVQPQNFSGLTFSVRKPRKSPLKVVDISTELNDSVPQASSTSISIPRTIFYESTITNSSRQQRIIFVFYKKTSFFKVSLEDTKKTSSRLNSFVIAGSIKGLSVANLSDPVEIALQSVARGDANSTLCSYWDFILANWSQEGCRFKRVLSDGRILCNCNHLTNFAMLMDINPAVTTKHERTLGVISYVGCALSLVGLTLTIITILILRKLRSKLPMKILLNFCTALSLTLIVFLAAPEGSKSSSLALCRTAAVALHYFLLAAFLWMAVEAFTLYLAIIKARKIDSFPSMFMLKCCLFAWGTPAIIVAITMIVALDKYGDKRNCRLHGVPFIVAFLTPVTLILAGNIVAFCLIIRSLLTSGNRVISNRKVSGLQQARQGIAIMVLLGLTWLFGILAIDDAKLAFQWLFCIFNSLQGFLVFILFVILPAGTRQQLRKLFRKKSRSSHREDPLPLVIQQNDQCSTSGVELKLDEKAIAPTTWL